jgi:NAD(P)-dependent dehydrogenase (short-subunit alcohol dehydrogenase family)
VVLAVRDLSAGQRLAEEIATAGNSAYVSHLDLADLDSVRAFAEREGDRPLKLLINNAGIMGCPFARTVQGFESQLGVNHVAHHLLAKLMLPALQRAAPSRVVALSSEAHRWGAFRFDDPNFDNEPYDALEAYGQSKTANALFAVAFDRRFAETGVRAFSVMPGGILTSLGRSLSAEDRQRMVITEAMVREAKSVPQGAATTVWAALGRELDGKGGLYLEDMAEALPAELADDRKGVMEYAVDPGIADRLWRWTEAALADAGKV